MKRLCFQLLTLFLLITPLPLHAHGKYFAVFKSGDLQVKMALEIADTPEARENGLMYRKSLPMNKGMLFVFPDETPLSFWMKNTLIPLDMIFMDAKYKIIKIVKNATPCRAEPCETYDSISPARFVFETNAGFVDKHKIRLGDIVTILVE